MIHATKVLYSTVRTNNEHKSAITDCCTRVPHAVNGPAATVREILMYCKPLLTIKGPTSSSPFAPPVSTRPANDSGLDGLLVVLLLSLIQRGSIHSEQATKLVGLTYCFVHRVSTETVHKKTIQCMYKHRKGHRLWRTTDTNRVDECHLAVCTPERSQIACASFFLPWSSHPENYRGVSSMHLECTWSANRL